MVFKVNHYFYKFNLSAKRMDKKTHILLFYKYVNIENPEEFAKRHRLLCDEIGLKGRILVAEEGINGSVSGNKEQTEIYKEELRKDSRFSKMVFKEDLGITHPFKKMIVKVKKEIVNFGEKVNLEDTGKYLSPREFLEIYNSGRVGNEIFILDARNEYESRVGKFKQAITPNIKTFREFPKLAEELKDKKDKKIVMYCTGGIRCEKASAYLKKKGFKDVCQLEGGILTFGKQFPDTIWEGKCFVFDKRLVSNINTEENILTKCEICGIVCDLYKNCANNLCDKYCIVCIECEKKYGGCCSKECFKEIMKERTENKKILIAA